MRFTRLDRSRGDAADQGSIILVFLVMLIASAMSLLVLGTMLSQAHSTQFATRRVDTLHVAQAGLDVALGQIRAANDGQGNGVLAQLPCGPLTGTLDPGGTSTYQVSIAYYPSDPTGQTASWLAANAISCTRGSGPPVVPGYALLTSAGADMTPGYGQSLGNRTLQTTYVFQTTNANIADGLIHIYNDGAAGHVDLCMDAGSAQPPAGTPLELQPCQHGSPRQAFAYQPDLTLVLLATQTPTSPGMCLDAPASSDTLVEFQPCTDGSGQTVTPEQQWSFNDVASFEGANTNGSLNGLCFRVVNPNTPGTDVNLSSNTCGGSYNIGQTWDPEPSVGAGAAGPSTSQLVNYQEFGRCLDVTNQNVNWPFLIDFPCKQAPNPSYIAWNQKFAYDAATKEFVTNPSAGPYCLQSPLGTASPAYVLVEACPATPSSNVQWTVPGSTGVYATSYTILDGAGNCLSLGPPGSSSAPLNQWSTITVAKCDGSLAQKWNAPPNTAQAAVQNILEK
ncbi:MAG: RICIN domain-containing protein [Mycobacteriales bacterium]